MLTMPFFSAEHYDHPRACGANKLSLVSERRIHESSTHTCNTSLIGTSSPSQPDTHVHGFPIPRTHGEYRANSPIPCHTTNAQHAHRHAHPPLPAPSSSSDHQSTHAHGVPPLTESADSPRASSAYGVHHHTPSHHCIDSSPMSYASSSPHIFGLAIIYCDCTVTNTIQALCILCFHNHRHRRTLMMPFL